MTVIAIAWQLYNTDLSVADKTNCKGSFVACYTIHKHIKFTMVAAIKKGKFRNRYLYIVFIVLLAFFFSVSGYWEITQNHLTYPKTLSMGYPPYFIVSLGVAKILGAIVLLIPHLKRLKEWAFAGFVFDVVFAFISGLSISSIADCIKAFVAFCALLFTYRLYHQIQNEISGKPDEVA